MKGKGPSNLVSRWDRDFISRLVSVMVRAAVPLVLPTIYHKVVLEMIIFKGILGSVPSAFPCTGISILLMPLLLA